ncbi:MAG TPA: pseudouridine synthase [Bacteroidales bacterium]|nr:pseudouridine synthase [Bacteroidales bacterium]
MKQRNSGRQREKEEQKPQGESVRLNKYIADSGLCSRREADELIASGQITVNGKKVSEMGLRIQPGDTVKHRGKVLKNEKPVYILLNKPKDVVTTVKDEHAKRSVIDLVKNACKERVYPVGRLDRNTTGLLLLTNDGELTKRLTHPRYQKKKVYHVVLDKPVVKSHLESIVEGIELDDEMVRADAASYVDISDKTQVGVEIHTGQNRVVRRIFESLGYRVKKLDRVYFAGLTKKNLPRGKWRFLTQKEVNMLKMNAFK